VIQINDQEEADKLLHIAVLVGIYPGMIIRSIRASIQILKWRSNSKVEEVYKESELNFYFVSLITEG
jgi:hypothetical protein